MYWGAEEVRHADSVAQRRHGAGTPGSAVDRGLHQRAADGSNGPCPGIRRGTSLFYQVIQERATQVSYLNLGLAVDGKASRLQRRPTRP